ncbi:MAG: hypothetical protein WC471_06135 [Candidatus Woesearchaeota archaeon]|jgi:hypothetical protein
MFDDLIGLGVGIVTGEALADALVDDDNTLGKVAVGFIGGGIAANVAKKVSQDTGIGETLDDIFGF